MYFEDLPSHLIWRLINGTQRLEKESREPQKRLVFQSFPDFTPVKCPFCGINNFNDREYWYIIALYAGYGHPLVIWGTFGYVVLVTPVNSFLRSFFWEPFLNFTSLVELNLRDLRENNNVVRRNGSLNIAWGHVAVWLKKRKLKNQFLLLNRKYILCQFLIRSCLNM